MVTRVRTSTRRSRRRRRQLRPVVIRNTIAFLIVLLHIAVSISDLDSRLEPMLMDYWFRLRGERTPSSQIVIVAIDERSYQTLGVSTLEVLPRVIQAQLLKKLADNNVQRVMYDLVFRSPSQNLEGDRTFAEALKLVPTFLGKYLKVNHRTGIDGKKEVTEEISDPLPQFAENARGTVFLNLLLDDRIVRRFITNLAVATPETPMAHVVFDNPEARLLPTSQDYIDYYGPAGHIPTISLSELLADDANVLGSTLTGKIVFVGSQMLIQSGSTETDMFLTPFSGAPVFGVEIHATVAANLLDGSWIRRLNPVVELTSLNVSALLIIFALTRLRPNRGIWVLCAAEAGWSVLSYGMFLSGIFLPVLLLVGFTLPLAFIISTLYYYVILQRSYSNIESALGVELKVRQ